MSDKNEKDADVYFEFAKTTYDLKTATPHMIEYRLSTYAGKLRQYSIYQLHSNPYDQASLVLLWFEEAMGCG